MTIAATMPPAVLPLWQSALIVAPTVVALGSAASIRPGGSNSSSWRVARTASTAMLAFAVTAALVRLLTEDRTNAFVRTDPVGSAVLVLVSFVGWVCIRYSGAYLRGDPHERRYIQRMMATLAAVGLVIVANNLLVLTLAWTLTSLALHGLLTFFGDRPAAVAAAHKKFLVARIADMCMLGAVVVFSVTFDTLRIDLIVAEVRASEQLATGARFGVALVALAALLKCAQLPFHGWLIQVMEAPTPVSALLHAGVVNLGGFILLRFAPVVDRATETRALLVVVGTTTAVLAALVMTTRISIKVSLAWSTCAQMGFMLMQCGLGAWGMALLHLLAHSLYKAHAFLGAGGTVRLTQRKQLANKAVAPTTPSLVAGLLVALTATLVAGYTWSLLPFDGQLPSSVWVLGAIVALALVPLMPLSRTPGSRVSGRTLPALAVGLLAVPFAYFGLHELFRHLAPGDSRAPTFLLVVVAAAFSTLFLAQAVIATGPARGRQRIYPWIYGGLFLDEAFTRITFGLWKPPATKPRSAPMAFPSGTPMLRTHTTTVGAPASVANPDLTVGTPTTTGALV